MRIQETKNLSTDAVAPIKKNPASKAKFTKKLFLCGNFTPFMSKSFQIWDHFFSLHFLKDSKNPKSMDIWFRKWGQKIVLTEWTNEKKSVKNFFCRGNFTPLMSTSFQIWDFFFPLLSPKDSKNIKSLDTGPREVGAKKS